MQENLLLAAQEEEWPLIIPFSTKVSPLFVALLFPSPHPLLSPLCSAIGMWASILSAGVSLTLLWTWVWKYDAWLNKTRSSGQPELVVRQSLWIVYYPNICEIIMKAIIRHKGAVANKGLLWLTELSMSLITSALVLAKFCILRDSCIPSYVNIILDPVPFTVKSCLWEIERRIFLISWM